MGAASEIEVEGDAHKNFVLAGVELDAYMNVGGRPGCLGCWCCCRWCCSSHEGALCRRECE
jgi:hypothetical protein